MKNNKLFNKQVAKIIIDNFFITFFLPLFFLASILNIKKKEYYIFGSAPLISNKYWSNAVKELELKTITIMETHYKSINEKDDFDLYFKDFIPKIIPDNIRTSLGRCFAFLFILQKGKVLHTSFYGFALNDSFWWQLEGVLLKIARIKIIVIPFGGDAYDYSNINNISLKYGLLSSYGSGANKASLIKKRIKYWTYFADVIIPGFMIDGLPKFDVIVPSPFNIDIKEWQCKKFFNKYDGINNSIKILHTPNHREFKGTEFIIKAVEDLKEEGYLVELKLLSGVQNYKVKELMKSSDILIEQLIFTGYAFSAIEGMASGLPVLSNLENSFYTLHNYRYSFLSECPIISATPENIKEKLLLLIKNYQLRKELGEKGRLYVEKYHSNEAAKYLFSNIYNKFFKDKDINLLNIYHPLKKYLKNT